MTRQPWHDLPHEIVSALRPVLESVADEMIDAVREVPAYARPLEGPFGEGIRSGVHEALRHFLAEIEAGGTVARSDVYSALGRGEMRAGRSLDSLLSAYRIGARVAWRRFAAAGVQAGIEPATLYLLAESIFAYIDVLSAESVEGYALEQSAAAGEAELRRRRVVRMLLREPAPEREAIEAAASDAGWQLPRTVAVLAMEGGQRGVAGLRLPADAISDTIGELMCTVIGDPEAPGRLAEIERAMTEAGATAALGTTVAWPEAAISFARARAVLELAGTAPGLVLAREHAGQLLLRGDRQLALEFAREQLAPLATLPAGARARMTETLTAWLAEQGRLVKVSRRLGIHTQTARYRMSRLGELFGGALDDPDARFWLELALRLDGGSER